LKTFQKTVFRFHQSPLIEKQMGGVVIGTDLLTSKGAVELAEKYDFLWAAIGLHPNDNLDEEFDELWSD
jgi:TatD DNase family protein